MARKSRTSSTLKPNPHASQRKGRHFLRAAVVPKTTIEVGEPVRVQARLRAGAPEEVTARIAGTIGLDRYVSFDSPGAHKVPLTIAHPDGRQDLAEVEFEVVENLGIHPYPILTVRQEPSNPFILHVSVKNADAVHRTGIRYEWEIAGHSAFMLQRPFFTLDCERLLNPKDLLISFDLLFTVIYSDGEHRTAKESFRVFNDYAWFKSRGILKPRLYYDYRARGAGLNLAASCVMVNDDDEHIEITGRQIEILHDDADRVIVPGPLERMDAVLQPRSRREFDCALLRRKLPQATLGYAVHFHGRTSSGLKVEASAYFEHYAYQTKRWSDVTSVHAVDLLNEVKAALAESAAKPRPPTPRVAVSATGNSVRKTMDRAEAELHAAAVPAALSPFAQQTTAPALTLTAVRNYVEAMRPMWTASEAAERTKGLDAIFEGGQTFFGQESDESFFLGKQCLLDEEPPTGDLFCKSSGKRGQVFVPARIMNGKKGDVVLLPGGPVGFIGPLLLALIPAQYFSHCGIMAGNFYKIRHATASEDWLEDQVIGKNFDFDRGSDGISPESLKYIWPGTVDQTIDEAFHGSYFLYESRDGKQKKPYKIEAFNNDPVFFMKHNRHIVFPQVLKPDPLLEGTSEFAHVRPTLHKVAEKAKQIKGHYRFYCYSNGAISLKDDTAHLAPDHGPAWWASGTRPMVCSSLVLAAVDDVTDAKIRLEGEGTFTTDKDLEKTPPAAPLGATAPDEDALVDPMTRDGMYFYTEEERLLAAKTLFAKAYEKLMDKAKFFGRLLTDAPEDFANQICNTFAFDYSGREFDDEDAKDSEKWRDPGDGRAISPDDMLTFWDPPTASKDSIHGLYGYAQRMVFRDGLLEERDIGIWVIREKIGKLTVTVSHQGNPIAGSDVKVGGQVVVTNRSGVAIVDLPEGAYTVEAGVLMNGLFFEGRATAQVTDRGNASVTVPLNDPPEFNRLVVIGGNIYIKDLETGPFEDDEILDEPFGITPVRLGPLNRMQSVPYVRKWGGEIRVEVRFDLTWNPDLSVTVVSNVTLYEGVSDDTDDKDGTGGNIATVVKDASNVPSQVFVRNDDEDEDDHVTLNILISNLVDL